MATKPRDLTPVQRDLLEGVEDELLLTQGLFRRAILATSPRNKKAMEAILDAAEPVANAQRAISAALGGSPGRARDILEEADLKRRKLRQP